MGVRVSKDSNNKDVAKSIEQRQVSAPESERSPTTNPNSTPREERRFGVVTFVGIDKNNAVFAKVEDAETKKEVFFHSGCQVDGAVLRETLRVSYILVEDKVRAGELRAAKGRVEDEAARRRGVVTYWSAEKRFGFVVETGAELKYWFGGRSWQGAVPPQVGMAVEFSGGKSTSAKHKDTLEAQSINPVITATPPVPPSAVVRRRGQITDIKISEDGKLCGHIEDNEAKTRHYFQSSSVTAGVDIVCGAPVSFALAPDPKDPTGSVAVQVAADAPPPGMRRGTVLWWDAEKTCGLIEEAGEPKNVFFHLTNWQGPDSPKAGMVVDFVAVPNHSHPDQRYGKKVLPTAAVPLAMSHPPPPAFPPAPPPVSTAPTPVVPPPPPPAHAAGLPAAPASPPGSPPSSAPPQPAKPAGWWEPPAESGGRCQGTVVQTSPEVRRGLIQPAAGGAPLPFSFDEVRPGGVVAEGTVLSYTTVPVPNTPGALQAVNIIVLSSPASPPRPVRPAPPP
eukprot:EG_transcript_10067